MTNYKCLNNNEYLLTASKLKSCNLCRNGSLSNHVSIYYINISDLYANHGLSAKEKIGAYLCVESQKNIDKYIFYTDFELGDNNLFELVEHSAINNIHKHKIIADINKAEKLSDNKTEYNKRVKKIKGKSIPSYRGIFFVANKAS